MGKQADFPEASLSSFKRRVAAHVDETSQAMEQILLRFQPAIDQQLEAIRQAVTVFSPAVLRSLREAVTLPEALLRSIRESLSIPTEQLEAFTQAFSTDAVRSAVLALEERGRLLSEFATAAS